LTKQILYYILDDFYVPEIFDDVRNVYIK